MEAINNIPQLIQFIETHHLNSAQICHILHKGYMLFADEEKTPQVLIKELTQHWEKYGNSIEKPLFLNLDLDVETFLESEKVTDKDTMFKEYKSAKGAIVGSLHTNSLTGSKNTYYLTGKPVLKFTDTIQAMTDPGTGSDKAKTLK